MINKVVRFIGVKPEGLGFAVVHFRYIHGAAGGDPVAVILIHRRLGAEFIVEETGRIEGPVADEPMSVSVHPIGAARGDDIDQCADSMADAGVIR